MVERRDRAGYWDGDTGVGKGTARIVTLVDRKSGWVRLCKVPDGTATAVAEAVLSVLDPVRARVHTLTWDDGSEFAEHRLIDTGRGQQLLRDAVLVLAAWFPSSAVGDVSC